MLSLLVACSAASSAACAASPAEVRAPRDILAPVAFEATGFYDELGVRGPLPLCAAPCERAAVVSFRLRRDDELHAMLARRSFVYDDALAVFVALQRGRLAEARRLGDALAALVSPSGTIGFSFDVTAGVTDGDAAHGGGPVFYDARYVRAGAVAWVGYALVRYDLAARDRRYLAVARRMARWLLARRVASEPAPPAAFAPAGAFEGDSVRPAARENARASADAPRDPRAGLVLAGYGRWLDRYRRFDAAYVAAHAATEHQIDAYFFLAALGRLDPSGGWDREAAALADATVRALWLDDEGRFAIGAGPREAAREAALDAAGAWGTLLLLARGDRARAERALAYTLRTFATTVRGRRGFAPYAGPIPDYPGVDLSRTFFAEGTASMGVALLRMGRRAEAAEIAATLRALADETGAVPYAFPPSDDFPDVPAAAPTAWLALLEAELAGASPTVFAPTP